MKTAELREHVGDDVFVHLPYDAGRGWALLLDPNAEPPKGRPGARVAVAFYEGETWPLFDNGLKYVRPADITTVGEYPGPRKPRVSPLAEALDALNKYGEHLYDCSTQKDPTGECSCGLDDALERLKDVAA